MAPRQQSTPPSPGGRAALLAAARTELDDHGHAGISLRAVARRAGVSHAAPKHHFPDRAALLTAIAAQGFTELTAALRDVAHSAPDDPLAALGRAYIDFGLAHPALFDLMFRPSELHTDDPGLQRARTDAIGELAAAIEPDPDTDDRTLTLIGWALAHGLTVLTRDGALQAAADTTEDAASTARRLAGQFAARLHPPAGDEPTSGRRTRTPVTPTAIAASHRRAGTAESPP